jgi:hypothetical protein
MTEEDEYYHDDQGNLLPVSARKPEVVEHFDVCQCYKDCVILACGNYEIEVDDACEETNATRVPVVYHFDQDKYTIESPVFLNPKEVYYKVHRLCTNFTVSVRGRTITLKGWDKRISLFLKIGRESWHDRAKRTWVSDS